VEFTSGQFRHSLMSRLWLRVHGVLKHGQKRNMFVYTPNFDSKYNPRNVAVKKCVWGPGCQTRNCWMLYVWRAVWGCRFHYCQGAIVVAYCGNVTTQVTVTRLAQQIGKEQFLTSAERQNHEENTPSVQAVSYTSSTIHFLSCPKPVERCMIWA
jgi:hypothetical protein